MNTGVFFYFWTGNTPEVQNSSDLIGHIVCYSGRLQSVLP